MRKLILAVLAMVTSAFGVSAGQPKVTREGLLKIVSTHTSLRAVDFEEYGLKDGRAGFGQRKADKGPMITFIGPSNDINEVIAIAGATETTFFSLSAMLSAFAIETARWDDGFKWVPQAIADTAKTDGGTRSTTVNGWHIEVGTVPPNILRFSARRQ